MPTALPYIQGAIDTHTAIPQHRPDPPAGSLPQCHLAAGATTMSKYVEVRWESKSSLSILKRWNWRFEGREEQPVLSG